MVEHGGRLVAIMALWLASGVVIGAHAGQQLAQLEVAQPEDSQDDVALFTASTVMDVPGGASVTNRLEVQCGSGEVNYIVIDFGTPRMAEETRTLDTRLAQRFAHEADGGHSGWRIHFDALDWQSEAPRAHEELRNLQLNRMVYRGDGADWVERLAQAGYLRLEQPAQGERAFLFELSHRSGELDRLKPYCGL
jgi:hypothetical protein